MARTDNLTNYLTDVASAIKEKKKDDTNILASNFDEEIRNLPSDDVSVYMDSKPAINAFFHKDCAGGIPSLIKKLPDLDFTEMFSSVDFEYTFANFSNLVEIPKIKFSEFMSNISLKNTCFNCYNLKSVDNLLESIAETNIPIVNFENAFGNCIALTNISFKNIQTMWVNSYYGAFGGCENLLKIEGIENLDTSRAENLSKMFASCKNLEDMYLETFDTSNALNMSAMFSGYKNLTTIPNFNTSKCKDFSSMFNAVESLTSLPELDFSSAENIDRILNGDKLQLTELGGFNHLGFMYTQKEANYKNYTLDLSSCPVLTKESVLNVFNKVRDLNLTYSGEETPFTQLIKLHDDVKALLNDEDIAIITEKGWTLA